MQYCIYLLIIGIENNFVKMQTDFDLLEYITAALRADTNGAPEHNLFVEPMVDEVSGFLGDCGLSTIIQQKNTATPLNTHKIT